MTAFDFAKEKGKISNFKSNSLKTALFAYLF
jgi:hypothetical protein